MALLRSPAAHAPAAVPREPLEGALGGPEARLAAAPQAASPRYLRTLLNEICVSCDYEGLAAALEGLLATAQTVAQLYAAVARLDRD